MTKENSSIKKATIFIQIFGLFVTGFYVLHTNKISTKGYELKELKEERENLLFEQESLNLKISRSQSIENIKQDVFVQSMQKYSEVQYFELKKEVASSN